MGEWHHLGPIILLQIQRGRVKRHDVYDPAPLLTAELLVLTSDGVMAAVQGGLMLDVHHRSHPSARRWWPDRSLSVGFTSHYLRMEDRFGPVPLGVAAENIIVDTPELVDAEQIAGGLLVEGEAGRIELGRPEVAEPCVPFTRYLLGSLEAAAGEVVEDRRFLDEGTRGYVMGLTHLERPIAVHLGDEVWGRRGYLPRLLESQAPTSTTPLPTSDTQLTASSRKTTPSSTDTTGIK